MKLVVISPESEEPREHAVLAELFAAGLERYHVRKPSWTKAAINRFVQTIPVQWRSRMVLHQCHELAVELGCGGVHFKDSGGRDDAPHRPRRMRDHPPYLCTSHSYHVLSTLSTALSRCDSVFFSPVFPSISKPGYEPATTVSEVAEFLARRTAAQRKTEVIALGGVTPANAASCAELGFDGVAVLGAIWLAEQPLEAFEQLQQSITTYAARTS